MLFTTMKHYSKKQFLNDLISGIFVSIIALPLSIALAISSGVSPEQGLFTAIIAGFIISFLGGSRIQISGPTGALMVIVYGIVIKHGIDGLIISTIMAGFILILFGLFRLGGVIKYIPYPITTGFTSGIALTIFSSQIKDFFGLSISQLPTDFIGKLKVYFLSFHTFSYQTFIVGLSALVIMILWPKVSRKIPGTIVAIILTTIMVNVFNFDVNTIEKQFGELSTALPIPHIPSISLETISSLIEPAFTIAILGGIVSLLSAVVSDGMIGTKHRSNMELIAQGIGNMASGIFGGIPATGAIARTVANVKNGGRTPIAGMVHAITLLIIFITLMPLARMIPLATLASIIMVVAYNMSSWREFKELFKAPKSDVLVLLITFLITVLIDLAKAIEIGMILAALLFMKRMSDVSYVTESTLDASEDDYENEEIQVLEIPKEVQVYEINGPFFFGAAGKFMETINRVSNPTQFIILRMRNVPVMDATALYAFKNFIVMSKSKHMTILISGINEQPKAVLKKAKLYDKIGDSHFFNNVNDALHYANVVLRHLE